MLKRLDFNGNPYLGVLSQVSDTLAVLAPDADDELVKEYSECFGAPVVRTTLGGSRVVGSLCAINSSGIVVTGFATDEEMEAIRRVGPPGMRILRLPDKLNAVGNNVLVNDRAALVHPDLGRASVRRLADALDVEVVKGTVAGMKTVGSAAVVTAKGVLCHPRASAAEKKVLREVFGVPVTVGTANYGSPMVGACVVANSRGIAAGTTSTGIELGRMEEALGFL
ncbi:MAG: translation initiation factor IF-6 [Thermoplasmata archaeon]